MVQDDFRAKLGKQDFVSSIEDKPTEEIEFLLETGKIADTEKRALAMGVIKKRERSSELAECQGKLRKRNIALVISAFTAVAAVASAVALWLRTLFAMP